MWGVHEGMGWWMVFGGLWMALVWGILIGGLAWAITRLSGRERSPLDIARERYVRGEISAEQFERMRQDLSGGR